MKKLLSILFLLSSPVLAIDKPIPCTGNSCKLLFETRDGSNVKVSAGEVSGTGAWTIGPSGYTGRHGARGRFGAGLILSVGSATADNGVGFFRVTTSSNSCDTACQSEESPMNTNSGSCLKAWDGSGNVAACATVATGTNCLCTGLY